MPDATKYKKVPSTSEASSPTHVKDETHIRISNKGKVSTYISYASVLFSPPATDKQGKPVEEKDRKKPVDKITISAAGSAISSAVVVSEIVKRRFKDMHSNSEVGLVKLVEKWEPIISDNKSNTSEKLEPKETTKSLGFLQITLARGEEGLKMKSERGYCAPLPESELELKDVDEILAKSQRKGKGGGKSKGSGGLNKNDSNASGDSGGGKANKNKNKKNRNKGGGKGNKGGGDKGGKDKKEGEGGKKEGEKKQGGEGEKKEGGKNKNKKGNSKDDKGTEKK